METNSIGGVRRRLRMVRKIVSSYIGKGVGFMMSNDAYATNGRESPRCMHDA